MHPRNDDRGVDLAIGKRLHLRNILETISDAGVRTASVGGTDGDDDLVGMRRVGNLEVGGEEVGTLAVFALVHHRQREQGARRISGVGEFQLSLPFMAEKLPFLITQGLFTTIYVSAISIAIASVIAILGAVAKLSTNGFAYAIASFYTSFFRGLPLLMQVYLIYLGLPQLGFIIDAVPAGILALSLCYGAYMTEIFRSGIQSIDRGQWEASRSIGFGFGITMRKIILPQALPVIIPPTGNQFISMLKDSSLVSVIGVWELMFLARTLGQKSFQHMEMLIAAAMLYWGLSICLELIQSRIERHYSRSKVR